MDETKGTATTVETSTEEKTTTNTGTETKDSKTGSGAVKTEEQIRAEVEAELKAKGATIAVSAVMTGSLLEGSKLEQSIGGVETLFKDSADIVKKNADAAFQTAGLCLS